MPAKSLQLWWAKWRLLAPISFGRANAFLSARLQFPELADIEENQVQLPPYEHLAAYYHDYAAPKLANYAAFLPIVAKCRGLKLHSVLDLACGPGTSTARLGKVIPDVTGLDISEANLQQAQLRFASMDNIDLVAGDFRDFDLNKQFDAVVCSTNSLNYVENVEELGQVFRCVARHLRPGGLFAFDTSTEKSMKLLKGLYYHVNAANSRFAIHFDYDVKKRVDNSRVMLPSGIELHRRIPLDPSEIKSALEGSRLNLANYFSSSILPGRMYTGPLCFFVAVASGTKEV